MRCADGKLITESFCGVRKSFLKWTVGSVMLVFGFSAISACVSRTGSNKSTPFNITESDLGSQMFTLGGRSAESGLPVFLEFRSNGVQVLREDQAGVLFQYQTAPQFADSEVNTAPVFYTAEVPGVVGESASVGKLAAWVGYDDDSDGILDSFYTYSFDPPAASAESFTVGLVDEPTSDDSSGQSGLPDFPLVEMSAHMETFVEKGSSASCDVFVSSSVVSELSGLVKLVSEMEAEIARYFSSTNDASVVEEMGRCEFYFGDQSINLKTPAGILPVYEGGAVGYQRSDSLIFMLSPGSHKGNRFGAGLDLKAYFSKVLMHEFFQGALYATNTKHGQYSFDQCPRWFVQGIEEFAGVEYAEKGGQDIWNDYGQVARKLLSTVDFRSPSLVPQQDTDEYAYFFGGVLSKWLIEQHGVQAAIRVAQGKDWKTCEEGLTQVFGKSQDWKKPFSDWLN